MNKLYLLFLPMLLWAAPATAQIYVKHDAGGANDGSSWSDAFNSLSDALEASQAGDQVWVAAGTYLPDVESVSTDAFFSFPHDLELYGGFDGSESNLEDRDWENNETILSGDHMGNDVNDVFDSNRDDNSKHVIWLTDVITNASIIDGFTIRNGNTEPVDGSGNDRRGGGILTYGAPIIRNCSFTQNYAYYGSGIYPRGSAAFGFEVYDCTFEKNTAGQGGGMYVTANSGKVINCIFDDNTAEGFGGGIYNGANDGLEVTDCMFLNNTATENRGGGVYNTASASVYTNCTFENNAAPLSSGGGLAVRHTDDDLPFTITVIVEDCIFTGNTATFGGGISSYDDFTVTNVTNSVFTENSTINVGGAFSNAFGATTNFFNCIFESNETDGSGGALYSQNDSSIVHVENCEIMSNSADFGGGIAMSGDNEPLSTAPLPVLTVQNTYISNNTALSQGGGINMSNGNMDLSNVVIDFNLVDSPDGYGGGISLNTSDSISTEHSMLNSSLVNNFGIGANIGSWEENEANSSSVLTLQNCILSSLALDNYAVELGSPEIVSNGGNLCSDASMSDFLIGTNDLNNADPELVDPDGFDYHLEDDSPCIDQGIEEGAPDTDIEGLPRVREVDMGAFENQTMVNTNNIGSTLDFLSAFPIPANHKLNYKLRNEWRGQVFWQIIDSNGKVVFDRTEGKQGHHLNGSFDVSNLPGGIYTLRAIYGSQQASRQFNKQ